MEAVIGLLLMILGVSHGVETSCDGRQDGAQCYGALGGTVVLRLMDSASEIFRYQWSTKTTTILIGRKNQIVSNEIKNRSFFTPSDGTFRINDLSWSDGGEYTLITFDSDGRITEQKTLQLTVQGEETSCDGRQDGAQCYGALGGTVVLRLMDSASEIFSYRWSNKTTTILAGRKIWFVTNEIENRSSFSPRDGTFRINNLSWSDGGEYKLSTYDSNGRRSEQRTLQLSIQAPVSSVLLVSECLSQGEMRVSCSSEGGDSPQYSWTLDGRTLTDAELLSGNTETTNITLKQHVSGQLVCSVRNKVSRISSGFIFSECICTSTEDHSLLICGVRAAVVILALIGICVFFAWKKKKYKMAAGSGVRCKRGHEENSVMMVEVRSSASELYCNL